MGCQSKLLIYVQDQGFVLGLNHNSKLLEFLVRVLWFFLHGHVKGFDTLLHLYCINVQHRGHRFSFKSLEDQIDCFTLLVSILP